jgi:hypothetical protein
VVVAVVVAIFMMVLFTGFFMMVRVVIHRLFRGQAAVHFGAFFFGSEFPLIVAVIFGRVARAGVGTIRRATVILTSFGNAVAFYFIRCIGGAVGRSYDTGSHRTNECCAKQALFQSCIHNVSL